MYLKYYTYLQGYKVIWANAIQEFQKYENQREEEGEGAEGKVGEGGGKVDRFP